MHNVPMTNVLKILLLEDNEDDAILIQQELRNGSIVFETLVVDTEQDYINGIHLFQPDIVISDHSMPRFNSVKALSIYKSHLIYENRSAPFILVTGTTSEEFAVQAMKDGADDYVLKDRLQRLPAAVLNALDKCSTENKIRRSAADKLLLLERYEYVTKATSDAIWDWDILNNITYCGEGFEKIFGHIHTAGANCNSLNTAYICANDIEKVMSGIDKAIAGNGNSWTSEYRYLKANGDYAFVLDKAIIIRNAAGKALRMVGAMQDITQKKKEDLRLKLLESVITNTTDAVMIAGLPPEETNHLRIVYTNDAFTKMTGYTTEEILGASPEILQGSNTSSIEVARLRQAMRNNQSCEVEMISYKKNGEEFWLNFSVSPVADSNGITMQWVFIERDVSQQKVILKQ